MSLTKKELAEAAGISRVALNQWEHSGCPVDEILEWPIEKAVEYLKDWQTKNRRPRYNIGGIQPDAEGTLQEQLLAAQIRKTNEDADAKGIKNAERRGQLLDAEETELNVSELTGMVRSEVECWPEKAIQELPVECRAVVLDILQNEVHLLLTRMSQWRLGE